MSGDGHLTCLGKWSYENTKRTEGRELEMQVVSMRRPRPPTRDAELKRLALQLAAQLPEDTQEALDALEYTKTLVRSFLGSGGPV
jgi:hypothetical protein